MKKPDQPWVAIVHAKGRISLTCRRGGRSFHIGLIQPEPLDPRWMDTLGQSIARTLNQMDVIGGQEFGRRDKLDFPTWSP